MGLAAIGGVAKNWANESASDVGGNWDAADSLKKREGRSENTVVSDQSGCGKKKRAGQSSQVGHFTSTICVTS